MTEAVVFRVATPAIFVHALDDSFAHCPPSAVRRPPGVGLGQHTLAAALIGLAFLTEAAATFVFWRRSRLARWAGPPRV